MPQTPDRPDATTGRSRTYIGIELLRFVTAAAVLVFHYQHFYFESGQSFDLTRQPFFAALSVPYRYGYFGVQVFWCISGFIFFARYGLPVATGRESPGRFALARFSRLYPLHWLTLFAVAALQWIYVARHGTGFVYQNNDAAHFAAQLAMAGSWQPAAGPATYSFNGPIWSVSLELLAYLVFFAVTRVFGASLPIVLATLVAVAGVDATVGHHPVFSCVLYFYVGAAVFRLCDALRTRRRRLATMALALAAAAGAATLAGFGKLPASVATPVLAPVALLVAALAFDRTGAAFTRVATVLGNTTYASYLLHFPFQLACVLVLEQTGIDRPLSSRGFFAGYIIVTFGLAMACHRWIEWPAQQWLRRKLGRRAAAKPPASEPGSDGRPAPRAAAGHD